MSHADMRTRRLLGSSGRAAGEGTSEYVELSFVFSAIRRRIWLVALFAILGLVVGAGIDQSRSASTYEARSTLLLQPPTSLVGGTFIAADPDRYVIGQLAALRSFALAQRVADVIPGETASSVQRAVRVSHRANTDLVDITARSDAPARSQEIANAYAAQYIGDLRSRIENQEAPGLSEFNARLADINERLVEVTQRVIANDPTGPTPNVRNFAAAEAERETLRADYGEVLRSKTQLEAGAYQRISSEVVEQAALPLNPTETSTQLFIGAGLLAGLSLGVVAAIMAARVSPMVIDRYEIETILKTPVSGDLVKAPALARSQAAALYDLPPALEQVTSRLAARAQANAVDDKALVVAVVGTQRGAGVSTLALALAGRFARTDNNVVLIDFDTHDPEITRSLASGSSGMPALLSYLEHSSGGFGGIRSSYIDPTTIFASTPVDRVRVLGVGSDPDTLSLRRSEISRILEYSAGDVDVVIADAGSLPDAAASEQLLRLADCVVLAVPMRRLRAATLETVGRLVASRSEMVLPVITHPMRRRRRRNRRRSEQGVQGGRRGTSAEARGERAPVLAGTGRERDDRATDPGAP